MRDNAAIEQEKVNLWGLMERLEKVRAHRQEARCRTRRQGRRSLDAQDPEKARVVREEMLFYTRQRTTDLLTQMAVSVQGYLALDLVKKNNIELLKGVDRASTTTVSALRTAVTVAQALTGQKLVLDQITALNTTTANVIDATGTMLRVQTAEIHKQAASSTIPVETLKQAFQNIYQTMDSIDTFKMQALESMKTTVTTLSDRSCQVTQLPVDRVRQQEAAAVQRHRHRGEAVTAQRRPPLRPPPRCWAWRACALLGCGKREASRRSSPRLKSQSADFTVLAGSEVRDIEPLLVKAAAAARVST
jgi:uncharacterized protein YaaN involved in tellurite resistance